MSEREEVLTYFGWQTCVMGDECCHDECRIPVQMADEIVRLRSQLTTAERERDEARRERDEAVETVQLAVARADEFEREYRNATSEYMKMRHRTERAESVVEAAKRWERLHKWQRDSGMIVAEHELAEAVRALDNKENL